MDIVDLDSEEYRKGKLGDDKYPCPRGCGQLTEIIVIVEKKKWKRGQNHVYHKCEVCKGQNVHIDYMNKFLSSEHLANAFRKILDNGKPGSLKCPSCRKAMVEISCTYDKNLPKYKSVLSGEVLSLGDPRAIIVMTAIMLLVETVNATAHLAKKVIHKSDMEKLTIDGCNNCNNFWFDKGELKILKETKDTIEP